MLEAERLWSLKRRYLPEVFRFQYVLDKTGLSVGFLKSLKFGASQLHVGQDLPVCELEDSDGLVVGYLLGVAVGPEGLIDGDEMLPFSTRDGDAWRKFERYLNECAGRFAFFLQIGGEERLYTDPVGMIGAVYERDAQRVASSPLLAIDREVVPNIRYQADCLAELPTRYSLFHTCDEKVKRLNPNFYLNLNTFDVERFWPRDEVFSLENSNHAETYDEITKRLAFNIDKITERHKCAMPITGGRDSRILAAVGRESLHKIPFFYTHVKNYNSKVDAHVGAAVAKSLNTPHVVLGTRFGKETKRWEQRFLAQAYQISHGSDTAPPKEYVTGATNAIPSDHLILRGHQTDLLRAVYVFKPKAMWSDAEWQIERMLIVPRRSYNSDICKHFEGDFFAWQATLPANAMEKAADFMFLEVYYNSTVGASFPALWQHFYLSPFNSRRLIELSLRFDEAERRGCLPVFDIVQKASADCARVPFLGEGGTHFFEMNRPSDYEPLSQQRVISTEQRLAAHYGGLPLVEANASESR